MFGMTAADFHVCASHSAYEGGEVMCPGTVAGCVGIGPVGNVITWCKVERLLRMFMVNTAWIEFESHGVSCDGSLGGTGNLSGLCVSHSH